MAHKSKETISESDSDASSRSTSPEPVKKKSGSKREEKKPASSESASGSGESESEDDSSDDKEETTKSSSKVTFHTAEAFKPPSGFKAVKKQSAPSSTTSSLLSNLHGKQVFHVTAPGFLPLSKVKEVSLAKIMQGEPVLRHEGVNYGIPAEILQRGDHDGKTLALYDSKTQTYYNAPTGSIPSYHVQELINLPESVRTDDPAMSATPQEHIRPARKQPKHLKMRFRPVGSGEGLPETIGSSSEESEGEKPTFKVPKGSSKEERKRKHHHTEGDGNQPAALPRKKSKKQSSSQEGAESPMEVDEKAAPKSKKSSKNKEEKKRKKEKTDKDA